MDGLKKKIAVAAFAVLAVPQLLSQAGVVGTDSGKLQGVTQGPVESFKGVPFAAPPVGELRWRAHQPVQPWSDVRRADAYSADCMQVPFPSDAAPLGTRPAEDCLYLNVWGAAGTKADAKLPVMFWIYGGGFVNGGSSPAVYDGSKFAEKGVVFVSANYRLELSSFLPFLKADKGERRRDGRQLRLHGNAAVPGVAPARPRIPDFAQRHVGEQRVVLKDVAAVTGAGR